MTAVELISCAVNTTPCRVLEDHEWQLSDRQQRYGTNEMNIPVKSVAALVADEMWHPFYVFQYFSVIIWVAGDQYYIYAVCIFLITAFSIITTSMETHQNMKRLAQLAHYTCTVGCSTHQSVTSRLHVHVCYGSCAAKSDAYHPAVCRGCLAWCRAEPLTLRSQPPHPQDVHACHPACCTHPA